MSYGQIRKGMVLTVRGFRRAAASASDYRAHGSHGADIRRLVFDQLGKFSPYASVERDGLVYFVSASDTAVGRSTFIYGNYEQDLMTSTLSILEQVLGATNFLDGRTFVDVGANIGTATIPAIRVFGAANAIAIEPAPGNVLLLQCNLVVNGLTDRVKVIQAAVSSIVGVATLELSADNSGDHRVRMSGDATDCAFEEATRQTVSVPTTTLDSLSDSEAINWDGVGVVWIDTQGHEANVLEGAGTLLSSEVPVVMEYWPYGLRRAGGLDLLHELVSSNYSTIIDVRQSAAERTIVELAGPSISALEGGYPGTEYTDLILLK